MLTKEEHLDRCKKRALEYVDKGDLQRAFASMISDLSAHPEISDHIAIGLGVAIMRSGGLFDANSMRKFIEDFR